MENIFSVKRAKDGPRIGLYEMLTQMEIMYSKVIPEMYYMDRLHSILVTGLGEIIQRQFSECSVCKCWVLIITTFIHIRLHHTLKNINESLVTSGTKPFDALSLTRLQYSCLSESAAVFRFDMYVFV